MSLSMNFFAFCLVATTFVRAEDAAPEEAPEDVTVPEDVVPPADEVSLDTLAPSIPEYEVMLSFTVGPNDPFTPAFLGNVVTNLIEKMTVGGIVANVFVKACEGNTCILAVDLASRWAVILQNDRSWDFTFNVRSEQPISDIESALDASASDLAGAVSPSATFTGVTAVPTNVARGYDDDDDLSGSAIAGIVIGCVLFVTAIVAVICVCKSGSESESHTAADPATEPFPKDEV